MICQVRSGNLASFWHDNWTGLGPLIHLTGANGPRVSGLSIELTVNQAASRGAWSVPRGRHPILLLLRACLPEMPADLNSSLPDIYLWRNTPNTPSTVFLSSMTWNTLHPTPPAVDWYSSVWFQRNIPKHSFITWVAARDRMPTRDKLRRWGIQVSSVCPLCDSADESREHLFFTCMFSLDFWNGVFATAPHSPPSTFEHCLIWFRSVSADAKLKIIFKIIFQAVVYLLWKERNSRIHNSVSRSVNSLLKELHLILRAKLLGMDRKDYLLRPTTQSISTDSVTYLQHWFRYFQP